ncbi:hypothetical protein [Dinoroseobacter sp. S76]|uniref:hypothetical protein n=1 Tax=Dinoroseobacter sp. S76 TaxID=3415124 RepID=UPI003C7B039C
MLASLSLSSPALAQDLFWDAGADGNDPTVITGGDGDWNAADPVWSDGAANTNFTDGASVSFGPGAPDPYTVTITEPGGLSVNDILFSTDVNLVSTDPTTLSVTGTLTADASVSISETIDVNTALTVTGTGEVTLAGDVSGDITSDVAQLSLSGLTTNVENAGGSLVARGGETENLTNTAGNTLITDGHRITGTTQIDGGSVTLNNGRLQEVVIAPDGSLTLEDDTFFGLSRATSVTTAGEFVIEFGSVDALTVTGGTVLVEEAGVRNLDIQGGTTQIESIVIVSNQTTVSGGSLTIEGGIADDILVSGTGRVVLDSGLVDDVTLGPDTEFVFGGGSFAEVVTLGGTVELLDGEIRVLNTNGTDAVLESRVLVTDATTVDGSTLTVEGGTLLGTTEVVNDGRLELNDAQADAINTIGNSAVIMDRSEVGTLTSIGPVTISDSRIETLEMRGDSDISASIITTFDNSGRGHLSNGTTVGSLTNSTGRLEIEDTVEVSSMHIAHGTVALEGGTVLGETTIDGPGTLDMLSGEIANITSAGTVNLDGGSVGTLHSTRFARLDGGEVGTLLIEGGSNQIKGTAQVTGQTTIRNGSFSTFGGTLIGDTTVEDGGSLFTSQGSISETAFTTIEAGGMLEMRGGTFGTLSNAGAIRMIDGQIGDISANTGTMTVLNGSLGAVTNSGQFDLENAQLTGFTNLDGNAELRSTRVRGSTRVEGGVLDILDVSLLGPTVIGDGGVMTIDGGETRSITVEQGGSIDMDATSTGDIINDGFTRIRYSDVGDITNGTDPASASDAVLRLDTGSIGHVTNNGGQVSISSPVIESLDNVSGTTFISGGGQINGDVHVRGGDLFLDAGDILGTLTTSGSAGLILGSFASDPLLGSLTLQGSGEHLLLGGIAETLEINTDTMIEDLEARTPVRVNSGTTELMTELTFHGVEGDVIVDNANLVLTYFSDSTVASVTGFVELQDNVAVRMRGSGELNEFRSTGRGNSFSLSNTRATETLTVTGDATTTGTTFVLDVDLAGATQSSDRLIFENLADGETVAVAFNALGSSDMVDGDLMPILVNTPDAIVDADFSALDASSGLFDYTLTTEDNLTYALQSNVSQDVMAIGAGFAATQSLIGAIVSRPEAPPTTPRDARRAPEALCGYGGWGRLTGGDLESETGFHSDTTRGTLPTDLDYAGVQLGADMACLNDRFGGWDLTFGGFLGFNSGQADTRSMAGAPLTRTEFDQSYAGLYLVAERGPLFADLQLRYEDMGFDVQSGGGSELDLDTGYDATALTLSGAIGYQWQVPGTAGLSVTPRAGFSLSRSETDQIRLGDAAVLEIDESDQQRAFAGLTLARSFDPASAVGALHLFGSLTYHADLSDGYDAALLSPEASTFRVDGIGDYTELSAGISLARVFGAERAGPARHLNAALRVDALSGESVDGWGLTGEIRFQF